MARNVKETVKALLRKAESMQGTPEGDALAERALAMMASYQIEVSLEEAQIKQDKVSSKKIGFIKPYVKAKLRLYSAIAKAYRCDVIILSRRNSVLHLFGYESDLTSADFLYDLLWLNGISELNKAAIPEEEDAKSFSTSFWTKYTYTIKSRLDAANKTAVQESTNPGTEIALYDRKKAAEKAARETYTNLVMIRTAPKVTSPAGYRAGQEAGERADLGQTRISGGRKEIE